MASRRGSDIERALLGKGFRLDANSDHRRLVLYVEDRQTQVRTKISHGNQDYGDDLLSKVRKQLRLAGKAELLDLVDCPMSGEEYLQALRDQGVL